MIFLCIYYAEADVSVSGCSHGRACSSLVRRLYKRYEIFISYMCIVQRKMNIRCFEDREIYCAAAAYSDESLPFMAEELYLRSVNLIIFSKLLCLEILLICSLFL